MTSPPPFPFDVRGPVAIPTAALVADEVAACRVCPRYAWAIDSRDLPLLLSLFDPEALVSGSMGEARASEYLPAVLAGAAAYEATQHNITNQYVDLDGDRARTVSYAVALHFEAEGSGRDDLAMGVQYRDEMLRTDGGWLIVRRATNVMWKRGPLPRS